MATQANGMKGIYMNVVLVSINSKYIHSSLAVWYLKAAAQHCAKISVIESTIKADATALLREITEKDADLVAFSCYIWNIEYIKKLLPLLKKERPRQKILLGGPEVSYCVEAVFLRLPMVDYIISGEGEEPFFHLLQGLSEKEKGFEVGGLCTKERIVAPYLSKKQPASPYTDEYFSTLHGRIAYIETSRGCPYSCTYCLSGRMGGVRFFELERVKTQLNLLAASGTQTIKFVDRTFNCNEKHALAIMRHILSKNTSYRGVCYHFEVAGDIMTQELISVFQEAPKGLFQIEVGVQSFNEDTLCAVKRKTDLNKVVSNLQAILEKGNVHVHMDLIAGLPYEDFASFKQGFNQLFALHPHQLQLGFLKRLYGSQIENEDVGEFSETAPYQVVSTPWMCEDDLLKLQAVEDAVDRLYNSGRFKLLVLATIEAGASAFDLFLDFGLKNQVTHGEPLEDYAEKVLSYFSGKLGSVRTKDLMREQWLKVNSSGTMLRCLKDTSKKGLLKKIDKVDPRKKGVKRAVSVLYGTKELIYVDYCQQDVVLKEYPAKKISWEE